MNNPDPILNLLTTLAECCRAALDHEMAQLDFERVKWEQHQEMEYTKQLVLGFQLFFLILIFLLLTVPPVASIVWRSIDHNHETIKPSVPLHPLVAPPVPRQLPPQFPLPSAWRYSL